MLDLFGDSLNKEGYLIGNVTHIIFQTNTSFFKVLTVNVQEDNLELEIDKMTVTGNLGEVKPDVTYKFYGKVIQHVKYGEQFQVSRYEVNKPTTLEGIINYLAGSDFVGIGQATAKKIVDQLGDTALDQLLMQPEVIETLQLTTKQKEGLKQGLAKNRGFEDILLKLSELAFSSTLINKIINHFQEKTLEIIQDNPYQLALEIDGIGFLKADEVALSNGIAFDDVKRVQAAICYVLFEQCQLSGNTYLDVEILLDEVLNLLQKNGQMLAPKVVADQIANLAIEQKIVVEQHRAYTKKFYQAEWNIAKELERLTKQQVSLDYNELSLLDCLAKVERLLGVKYDEVQKNAIKAALQSKVFLLTGGPGTGKTTIINGIVAVYGILNDLDLSEAKKANFPIRLAAPTGRAAKRMSEATGLPAVTIHRLLGLNGYQNDYEPIDIEGSLLIIDETSMVDVELMSLLLQSTPTSMQVIFVGDKHQLPSVGPGQVFADLLESQVLAKEELVKIYRQGDDSSIATLAAKIKAGQIPSDLTAKKGDRSFISCQAYQMADTLKKVIEVALSKGNQPDDIQVLAPMYRGQAGIDALNQMLQELFNPAKPRKKEIKISDQQIFRIGDRVLQLVNDPEKNVFNGDIGKIIGIDDDSEKKNEQQLIVSFEQNEITYQANEWRNLTLAYCMSIHKSQGGEFPIVLLPMVRQYQRMFARNLLYTAVTRAKEKLILLGEVESFKQSIKQISLDRQTTLQQRLQVIFEVNSSQIQEEVPNLANKPTLLSLEMILNEEIDPMIGMQGLTPASFMR